MQATPHQITREFVSEALKCERDSHVNAPFYEIALHRKRLAFVGAFLRMPLTFINALNNYGEGLEPGKLSEIFAQRLTEVDKNDIVKVLHLQYFDAYKDVPIDINQLDLIIRFFVENPDLLSSYEHLPEFYFSFNNPDQSYGIDSNEEFDLLMNHGCDLLNALSSDPVILEKIAKRSDIESLRNEFAFLSALLGPDHPRYNEVVRNEIMFETAISFSPSKPHITGN